MNEQSKSFDPSLEGSHIVSSDGRPPTQIGGGSFLPIVGDNSYLLKVEAGRAYSREYYRTHKSERTAYIKEYRKANEKKLKAYSRAYYQKNKGPNAHRKKKKLENVLRSRLSGALRSTSTNTLDLIGCTPAFLRSHIAAQFTEGMTWKNTGWHGWRINYIRPCASFDLTDPAQQRECFHFSNLQPLWAKDNLYKSATWNGLQLSSK